MITCRAAVCILSMLALIPSSLFAYDISGESRTYGLMRETTDGRKLLPLYEYLDLRAGDDSQSVSFRFGGWLRYDLRDASFRDKKESDLQYAYLALRPVNGAALNLGRVVVAEGAAFAQIDGAYARADVKGGFTVAAFGGSPVETSADSRSGDSAYGGRLSHRVEGIYSLGISYLEEKNDGKQYRKEEGVDLWLHPFSKLDVQGMSSYNAELDDWMMHSYNVSVGPLGPARIGLTASRINYREYFSSATMSAFWSPLINPDERLTSIGGRIDYALTSSLTAALDYTGYDYNLSGGAAGYGGSIGYAGSASGLGASIHRMDGESDRLAYTAYRAYGYRKVSALNLTLDLLQVAYRQPVNGMRNASTAAAAAAMQLTQLMGASASVEYSKNPDFDRDVRALVAFTYRFDGTLGTPAAGSRGK